MFTTLQLDIVLTKISNANKTKNFPWILQMHDDERRRQITRKYFLHELLTKTIYTSTLTINQLTTLSKLWGMEL